MNVRYCKLLKKKRKKKRKKQRKKKVLKFILIDPPLLEDFVEWAQEQKK